MRWYCYGLVAVFCPAEVCLFCFDRSVLTLFRRPAVTSPSPPSEFLLSVSSLYSNSANIVFLVLCIHSSNPQILLGCQTKIIAKNKIYLGFRPWDSLLLWPLTAVWTFKLEPVRVLQCFLVSQGRALSFRHLSSGFIWSGQNFLIMLAIELINMNVISSSWQDYFNAVRPEVARRY